MVVVGVGGQIGGLTVGYCATVFYMLLCYHIYVFVDLTY